MKKFVIGCLIVVVLAGIGGAVGAYYFLWRPARALVAEINKLHEIPKLNQQVANTTTFTPPADNRLAADGVGRFIRTQQGIQAKLGVRLDEFAAKYKLLAQTTGTERRPSFTELFNAYRDLAGLIVEAKRAQVEALNQNNFSLAEYDWTRRRVYEAAGIPINADFEKILNDLAKGGKIEVETSATTPPPGPEAGPVVPEQNKQLVAPHLKELAERAVLAAFGL